METRNFIQRSAREESSSEKIIKQVDLKEITLC